MNVDVNDTEERAVTMNSDWQDWGGAGSVLHFAHANGFPPGTYCRLIEGLAERHHVVSMNARPLWPDAEPLVLQNWSPFAMDLQAELNRRGLRGIVGVGHSLGAVTTLIAAASDPELFSAVVAVDPLILTGMQARFWQLVKVIGLQHRIRLVRGARRRRAIWRDRDEARTAYRSKRIFSSWDPKVLDDYLKAGMTDMPQGGVGLRYPREWEARIFAAAPHDLWAQLRKVSVPCLFVRGESSDTFLDAARVRIAKEMPAARTAMIADSSHFLPMERPEELTRVINEFLEAQGV